jgi:phytoene dehydrogenase-like protein
MAFLLAAARLRGDAPHDVDFYSWAAERAGPDAASAAAAFIAVWTFSYDTGRLSAAFVQERFRRAMHIPATPRYVIGGWNPLVEAMESRARSLGVSIFTSCPVDTLPESPVIIATELPVASKLLKDPNLQWTGADTVTVDLGLASARRWPGRVIDLDEGMFVVRYTAVHPSFAPEGEDLVQAQGGVRPGESMESAVGRLESLLDLGFPGWRGAIKWRRQLRLRGKSGALDLPGKTWRDRPAVVRGDGVFLGGDTVAAPGLLSEVSFESARQAARGAMDWARPAQKMSAS